MATMMNFDNGIIITIITLIFGAGGFYQLGIFTNKKLDKISDDVSCIKNDISCIKIEQAKTEQIYINADKKFINIDQRLLNVEKNIGKIQNKNT